MRSTATHLCLMWCLAWCSQARGAPSRVLVINSYTPSFPTTPALLGAISEELPESTIDVEYLASKAAWSPAYAATALSTLQGRIERRAPYDVIIATDDHALDIVLMDGGATFSAPVVAVGINRAATLREGRHPHGLTGAVEHIDLAGTLEMATLLQPQLQQVSLVVDGSASGAAHLAVALEQLAEAEVEVVVRSLAEESTASLETSLAFDPEGGHAIVVLSAHLSKGVEESFESVHRRLCLDGRRWCYTPFTFALGAGVVGGSVIDLADHGHIAGRYARAVIDGTPIADLPITGSEPVRVMTREGAALHGLSRPSGVSWYPQRRAPPWLAAVIGLVALGGLVGLSSGALLWRRRREASRALSDEDRHLADVGRVAVGVAHDLNNLLTIVEGYRELITLEEGLPERVKTELSHIGQASERAARLTHRVLAWGTHREEPPKPLVVGEHIADLAAVLRRVLGRTVRLHLVVDPDALTVVAGPTGFDQMLLNLISNARDAGAQSVQLEVVAEDLDAPRELLSGSVGAGSWVVVRALDDGKGIDQELRKRVIERGYSTKDRAGTGIGLATVVANVRALGGAYELRGRPEGGAVAELWLPRLSGDRATTVQAPILRGLEVLYGEECILVVDDDPDIRRVLRRTLEAFGYQVATYRSGHDALAHVPEPVVPDLAIVDIGLGSMRGPEFVERLHLSVPLVPVIFITGSGEHISNDSDSVVEKPFDTTKLVALVRSRLDRRT